MICPVCGGNTLVKDTRHNNVEQETYRYRICQRCSYNFYSVEFIADADRKFMRTWLDLDRRNATKKEQSMELHAEKSDFYEYLRACQEIKIPERYLKKQESE